MIELVRAGRTPEELAKEFEPSAQAIRNWVAQADRDEGRRADGLTTAEREELDRLRRENRQLKLEREILSRDRRVVHTGVHCPFVRPSQGLRSDPCARRRNGYRRAGHPAASTVLSLLLCLLEQPSLEIVRCRDAAIRPRLPPRRLGGL